MTRIGMIRRAAIAIGVLGFAPILFGKPLDLIYRSLDLKYHMLDLRMPSAQSRASASNLKSEVVDLKSAGADIKESDSEIKISLQGEILFDFDKSNLRPAAEPVLIQITEMIKKFSKPGVLIEGHTDGKGSPSYEIRSFPTGAPHR